MIQHYRYLLDVPDGMIIADTVLRKVRTIIENETTDQTFDEARELVREIMVKGIRIPIPSREEWENAD